MANSLATLYYLANWDFLYVTNIFFFFIEGCLLTEIDSSRLEPVYFFKEFVTIGLLTEVGYHNFRHLELLSRNFCHTELSSRELSSRGTFVTP